MLRGIDDLCGQCFLRLSALCTGFQEAEFADLEAISQRRVLARSESVELTEIEGLAILIIRRGGLKVSLNFPDGRDQIIDLLGQGDALLISQGNAVAWRVFRSIDETELCIVDFRDLESLHSVSFKIWMRIVEALRSEINRKNLHLMMLGRRKPEQRMALFLLDKHARCASSSDTFSLPESRRDIADHLSLSIETVSRTMTRLRDVGVVETPDLRSVKVLDREELLSVAENGLGSPAK